MSGTIVTNLPDDDEPLPRRKPTIDEVHAAHECAEGSLPDAGVVARRCEAHGWLHARPTD